MDRQALIDLTYAKERQYGLPKGSLVALLHTESSDGTNNLNKSSGATGPFQFMPATARGMGIDPNDPEQAADGAARLLSQNMKQSGGDLPTALRLYQGGPNRSKWGHDNAAYVPQVTKQWATPDLVDDVTNFNPAPAPTPAPSPTATPAATPAAPTQQADDFDFTGGKGAPTGGTGPADTTPVAHADPYVDLKAGMQHIVNAHRAMGNTDASAALADVKDYATSMGYDPSQFQNLAANVQTGQINFGSDFHPTKIDPNALNSFGNQAAGAIQAVPAALNTGAAFMDRNVPALGALDGLVGMTPDKFAAQAGIQNQIAQASQASYPGMAGNLGRIAGTVMGTAPFIVPAMAALPETGVGGFLAGRTGGNLLTRAASMSAGGALGGAAGGGLSGQDIPQAALGGAVLGPVFGAIGGGAARLAGRGLDAAEDAVGPSLAKVIPGYNFVPSVERNAANLIAQRVGQDASAGGPSVADIQGGAVPGKPLSLMDLGGENVRALAGRLARAPGAARQTITNFLTERDIGNPLTGAPSAGQRLSDDVRGAISNQGPAFDTAGALTEQRAADAAPLYGKAFAGGSTAPLETQFQGALQASGAKTAQAAQAVNAAQNEATQAAAEVSRGGDNVYASGQALARQRAAQQGLTQAQSEAAAAQAEHAANLSRLQQAQADGSANAPGAAWSPRIQQFLDDPIMKGGLSRGLEIQRLEAVASGKPFNPREYAVTGTDDSGQPQVGAVPNMRLLDAGKRGLDAIINDHTDAATGKVDEYGRAVTLFKKSYLGELDNVNPDYAAARSAYSGPSQSMDALRQGQKILSMDPSEIKAKFGNLSPGDQEFFRQGAASKLLEKIAKTSSGGDESLKLSGNDWVKQQLSPLFKSPAEYDAFANRVDAERTMFRTKQSVIGGSPTAPRFAEDTSPLDQAGHVLNAVHGLGHAAAGNPMGVLSSLNSLMRLSSPQGINPALSQELGNQLTAPLGQNLGARYGNAPRLPNYLIPPALAVGVNKLRSATR